MNPLWTDPPADPAVAEGIVHIWFRDLRRMIEVGNAIDCLSADERARAARISNEESRLTYLGSHVFLRQVLAGYLGAQPAYLRFEADAHGKPHIIDPSIPSLEFNLSHSHLASACAVTVGARIGIDLERFNPSLCDDATAELVFSPAELHRLARWKGMEKCDAFFRGWTRKEAYAKCLGLGMTAPLKTVELGFAHRDAPQAFMVNTFTCPNQYVASVAVAGKPAVMKFWNSSRSMKHKSRPEGAA